MMTKKNSTDAAPSRREFLKTTTAAGAALMATGNYAYAQGTGKLRVALIGCGGRGTGAAAQALAADPGAVLTAMGDVYKGQIEGSLANIKGEPVGNRVEVTPENYFTGLDAYQKVLATNVDVVLLATPPGFRPLHIKASVDAGKHVFAEKPMGTDAAGVRAAYEAAKGAAAKKLAFVAGFCWRYDYPRRAFYKKIHEGEIGAVKHVHATYLTGPVKPMPPAESRPAGMSDTEWQIRNWYNFVWLCGDGLIEQACHSVDKILWAMKDEPPLKCVATGGRVLPNGEGNIYDHIDVFYEWPDGVRATMAQRQIPSCQHNDNSDYIAGSKGYAFIKGWNTVEIHGETPWKYAGPNKNMYQVEHDEMFASIRNKTPLDNSERMWRSTLVGLMGRMAAYTGEEITWDQMLKSQENLFPEHLDWNGKLAIAPMAIPGRSKYV
jgi:myo-inositol 2-dehydrogenase / D-chiro-inositol 1-dehydrogenase